MAHQLCITRHESAGQPEPFAASFTHEVGLTSEGQRPGSGEAVTCARALSLLAPHWTVLTRAWTALACAGDGSEP